MGQEKWVCWEGCILLLVFRYAFSIWENDQTIVFIFPEGGQPRSVQPFSDEDASIETMSHCSGFSDPASFTEDGIFFFYIYSSVQNHKILIDLAVYVLDCK